jgi:hypothetical protein
MIERRALNAMPTLATFVLPEHPFHFSKAIKTLLCGFSPRQKIYVYRSSG